VLPVDEAVIRRGLEQVRWPGRLQLERLASGQSVLLDGAHNPAGALALRHALERSFPQQKPTLILGVLQDKDWPAMCHILVPLAGRSLLAPVSSERTAAPADLEALAKQLNPRVAVRACGSLQEALASAQDDPFVLITGSLHFIGDAMELLNLVSSAPDERGLNEWDAAGTASRAPIKVKATTG
jgi:dihydrofolate synthase/folylpolyglutamate synthase